MKTGAEGRRGGRAEANGDEGGELGHGRGWG